ncbi:MAG: hypothetical protein FWH52_02110 [Synergistaceae bacterium]|nr:hypothetical protein [Synergistaceae bacterium]
MRRNRVDWEKEMHKTEEIRMRGFKTSILGFAIAVLFLFGASRINSDASFVSHIIMIGCFIAATIVLVFTLKRRAKKLKQMRDEEHEENN